MMCYVVGCGSKLGPVVYVRVADNARFCARCGEEWSVINGDRFRVEFI